VPGKEKSQIPHEKLNHQGIIVPQLPSSIIETLVQNTLNSIPPCYTNHINKEYNMKSMEPKILIMQISTVNTVKQLKKVRAEILACLTSKYDHHRGTFHETRACVTTFLSRTPILNFMTILCKQFTCQY